MDTDNDKRKKSPDGTHGKETYNQSKIGKTHRIFTEGQRRIFPDWRGNVKVDDIPVIWDTNLGDADIRRLYSLLKSEPEFEEAKSETKVSPVAGGLMIKLPTLIQKWIDFKEGACWIIGLGGSTPIWLWVRYRSSIDWELWDAHQKELQELREEKQQEIKAEKELFKTEDNYLEEQINEKLIRKEYDQVAALINLRFDLRIQHKHLKPWLCWAKKVNPIFTFCQFPNTDAGIAFLERQGYSSFFYELFARHYLSRNRENHTGITSELDKIFRAAVTRFPTEARLHGRICRFWRRNAQILLAIEYCQLAIDKGLNDGSKTGFLGALKRFRKMAGE